MLTKALTVLAVFALAANVATARQAQPAPPAKAPETALPAAARPVAAAQLVNIKIELTISDQRAGVAAPPRTVTMLVQDRESGRLRTDQGPVNARLAMDARPEILANGRIRVALTLEYRPQAATDEDKVLPSTLTESLTAILEDGKPLMVSQSGDPTSSRVAVKVEVKATVLR